MANITGESLLSRSDVDALLDYVKKRRAIDFNSYRPDSIARRIERRLLDIKISDIPSYIQFADDNPHELDSLIDSIGINVSSFFRNPLVFELLRNIVIPSLIDSFEQEIVKIWCAGCSRGEEVYSVAIIIRDIVKNDPSLREKEFFIIGTDIDKTALGDAIKGEYPAESLVSARKGYVDSYFVGNGKFYKITDEIKKMAVFGFHDVTSLTTPAEGVFSNYQLILCRNLLIYFNRDVYDSVINGFSRFVSKDGYLILGESEIMPAEQNKLFREIIPSTRIFLKTSEASHG